MEESSNFFECFECKTDIERARGFHSPFFYLISCFLALPLFDVLYIILKIMTFLTTYYFHIMSHLLLVLSLTDDQIKVSATFGLYLLFNLFVPNAPFLYPLTI